MRQPIQFVDGAFSVVLADGSHVALKMDGLPITAHGPEWFLDCLYPGVGRLQAVQWKHKDGKSAVHYYDQDFRFVAPGFAAIPFDWRGALTELCVPEFRRLWKLVMGKIHSDKLVLSEEFLSLGPSAREDIAQNIWSTLHRNSIVISLDNQDLRHLDGLPFGFEQLKDILYADWTAIQLKAIQTNRLTLFVGGREIECTCGLWLHSNGLTSEHAYRFTDLVTNEVFFLVCSDWNYSIQALYFPNSGKTIFKNDRAKDYVTGTMGKGLDQALFEQIMKHADELVAYISEGDKRTGVFYFYNHIGHHLWNELTGLKEIIDQNIKSDLSLYIINSELTEMYGKLEHIFPEIDCSVDRSIRSLWELPEFLYANRVRYVHPTMERITTDLRQRIMAVAKTCKVASDVESSLRKLEDDGFFIVMIGFRVENRTLDDLTGFCRAVIDYLSTKFAKLAIIVDGHNAPNGIPELAYRSLGGGTSKPTDVEFQILQDLQDAFYNRDDIRIISTIGQPVAVSITSCNQANFFITPWGAGLAKYRWVCNLPGLVVSSDYMLRHSESTLYDQPRYLENRRRRTASIRVRQLTYPTPND